MKIGLDITPAIRSQYAGIPLYTYNLARYLAKNNTIHNFLFFHHKVANKTINNEFFGAKDADINYIQWGYYPELLLKAGWYLLNFPTFEKIYAGELDVFHYSYDTLIPGVKARTKKIITFHDITPQLFPHSHKFHTYFFYHRLIKFITSEIDIIIVPSFNTKCDIIKTHNISEHKIRVVYHGRNFSANLTSSRLHNYI